ncbi:MAG: tetratricopeptide repeat protein [Myxococcales bacterium]|nr:tetratricopeptide repeat protein [Myxococcales bacterium]
MSEVDVPIHDAATEPGSDGGGPPALAAARPPDDLEARRVRAAARAALFGDGEPVRVGRFTLLERLGAGAMGVVYAAWDPQLDRKVALKLVHPHGGAGVDGHVRLLAEARAAAKLAHPAVVAIYDAGAHADDVWIAMEFVAGRSLRAWAATEPRWQDVVAVARQVASGLAAAHAAGLLHRDVKPDNILVDARGPAVRAWIADFGLAISQDGPTTASGSGTPAYMAPEQHRGEPATAATDQFGFGVAFLEVLDGDHPFAAEPIAVAAAVQLGEVRAPRRRAAPAWVRDVLVRAVAPTAGARWPSLEALAAALARDPRVARRRLAAAAALVVVGGVGGALAFAARADGPRDPCAGAAAAIEPVWPRQRATVATALAAIDRPWAAGTSAAAVAELDAFAGAWRGQRLDVCRATRVRHQQSDELMDLRAACLERVRQRGAALVAALATADVDAAERAVQAIAALPAPTTCADELALRRVVPLPEVPAAAAASAALTGQLADARAAVALGRPVPALPALAQAVAAFGWAPLMAEAAHVLGQAAEARGEHAAAATYYQRALYTAIGARADRAAADAALRLVWVEGFWRRSADAADRWDAIATALVEAAGDATLAAVQLDHRGVRMDLARDLDAAERLHRAALARLLAALGPEHPSTLNPRINLAATLIGLGRLDEAAAELARARADATRILGEDHPLLGPIVTNQANVAWRQHRYPDARADFERALAIKEATLGRDHVGVASTLTGLAGVMGDQGDLAPAVPLLRRAIALYDRSPRGDGADPRVVNTLINLAITELELGVDARPDTARLLAVATAVAGPTGVEDPSVFLPRVLAGWAELAAGDAPTAVRLLTPLLTTAGFAEASPSERLDLLHTLARAIHASGGAPARLRAILAQAAPLVTDDDIAPRRRAQIERERAALAAPR